MSEVAAGDTGVRIVLEQEQRRGRFEGRLEALDGSPLAGVTLRPYWSVVVGNTSRSDGEEETVTDEHGRFLLEEVPLGFNRIEVEGPGVMPEMLDVDPEHDGPYQLTAPRRASFSVRTRRDEATHFMLIGADGVAQVLLIFQWILDGTLEGSTGTYWGELEEGASPTYTVSEGPVTIRLYRHEELLGSVETRLVGGETREIRVAP